MWLYDREEDKEQKYYTSVHTGDSLLDCLSFQTLITELKCNYRPEEITPETAFKQFSEDLSTRIEDAHFLLNLCMDKIIDEAKRY